MIKPLVLNRILSLLILVLFFSQCNIGSNEVNNIKDANKLICGEWVADEGIIEGTELNAISYWRFYESGDFFFCQAYSLENARNMESKKTNSGKWSIYTDGQFKELLKKNKFVLNVSFKNGESHSFAVEYDDKPLMGIPSKGQNNDDSYLYSFENKLWYKK
jgi:poly(A) polymerase Pap1